MLRYMKHFVLLTACTLASCSTVYGPHGIIQNRGRDYLEANNIPPLRIPPGLSSSTIEQHYPVSERYYPDCKKEVKLTPPELSSSTVKEIKGLSTEKSYLAANLEKPKNAATSQAQEKTLDASAPMQTKNLMSNVPKQAKIQEKTFDEDAPTQERVAMGEETIQPNVPPKERPIKPVIRPSANPVTQPLTAPTAANQSLTPKQQAQIENHYYDSHTRSSTGGLGQSIVSIVNKVWPWGKKPASQDPEVFGKPATEGAAILKETAQAGSTDTSGKSRLTEVKPSTPSTKSGSTTVAANNSTPNNEVNEANTSQPSSQPSKMPAMYFDRFTRR